MKLTQHHHLKNNEVHIWSASLSEEENDIDCLVQLLSEDEVERVTNYKLIRDQRRFIISRSILRLLLSKYINEEPQNIKFSYGLWGKPCLCQQNTIYFNLSHSKDQVLYAFALEYEIGVDLEYIDKNIAVEEIVECIFSKSEIEMWKSVKHEDKIECFFKTWVCKEAFLKATGKGWMGTDKTNTFKDLSIEKLSKSNKVTNPFIFNCIPNFASAIFVDGPSLHPTYYNWHQSVRNSL